MSLRVRRVPSVKYKILTAVFAAFALIAQPMYGLVASQVASAISGNGDTLQAAIDSAPIGGTVTLTGNVLTDKQITVSKSLTINGAGHTITGAFAKTDNDNNSVLSPQGASNTVTINNLTVSGAGGTNLHGINVYRATTNLHNVSITNTSGGSSSTYGLMVNNATVTVEVEGIFRTSGNDNGVNVDQAPAMFKMDGQHIHSGGSAIVRQAGTVSDTHSQYSHLFSTLYTVKNAPSAPSFQTPTPAQNSTITSSQNVTVSWNKPSYATTFEYRIDGGVEVSTNSQSFTRTFANGTHTVQVRSVAASGLAGNWNTARTFTVDVDQLPIATITTPTDGGLVSTKANGNKLIITGTYTDDRSVNYLSLQLVGNTGSVAYNLVQPGIGSLGGPFTHEMVVPTNLADGAYRLIYTPSDYNPVTGGQFGVQNEVTFTIDNTAPAKPTITTPGDRQWFKTTPIANKWTAVTDANGIAKYQVAYAYADGHGFGGSTCPGAQIGGINVYCRDETGLSRNHQPAIGEQGKVTVWVRAIDGAGNASDWSKSVTYGYDATDPTTNISVGAVANGKFTVSGHATDNLELNRVYVQLVNRATSQRYGGTTVNLIGQGSTADWSVEYAIADLPEGNYAAHVSVVDMAGNSSSAGWTDNFFVDRTPPSGVVTVGGTDVAASVTLGLLSEAIKTPVGWTKVGSEYVRDTPHTSNGTYSVVIEDLAGNTKLLTYSVNSIDDVAPVVTVDEPVVRNSNGSYTITGTTSDPTDKVMVAINSGTAMPADVTGTTWSLTTAVLPYGDYDVTVTSTDTAGNVGVLSPVYQFSYVDDRIINNQVDALIEGIAPGVTIGGTGASTQTLFGNDTDTVATDTPLVLGAQTSKQPAAATPALEATEDGWKIFGLAWYWWLLILAALAAIWWMIAGLRRRQQDDA